MRLVPQPQYGLAIGVLSLLVIATRWPLRSTFLFNFDAANFSFALEEFNPALHQPPGYPFFVALLKILEVVSSDPAVLLPAAGVLGSIVALTSLHTLANAIFGRPVGTYAAALFLVHPAFWYAGIANLVRVFLAAGSAATALACWTALKQPHRLGSSLLAGTLLGTAAGFRPELLLFLTPLVTFAALGGAGSGRRILLAGGAAAAISVVWLWPMTFKMGGVQALADIFVEYVFVRSQESAASGGSFAGAAGQALRAMGWSLLPAVSWAWVCLLIKPESSFRSGRSKWVFLVAWALPGMLFHALVHVHHPDQMLASAPVICLAGGWALSRPLRWRPLRVSRQAVSLGLLILAGCANIWFFLDPVSFAVRSTGFYQAIRWTERVTVATMRTIDETRASGEIYLVSAEGVVSRRQLAYYFPDILVVALPTDLRSNIDGRDVSFLRGREVEQINSSSDAIPLPAAETGIWIAPWEAQVQQLLSNTPRSALAVGGVWRFRCGSAERFEVGEYRFECR